MPEAEYGLMTFDEAGAWLDEAAERLPPALFEGLNGGIVLLPDEMPSPNGNDLYTLGLYHNDPLGMGRYITLYYGSFARVFGSSTREKQRQELDRVLRHELTHHIESLAGVRDLEVKDAQFLEEYRRDKGGGQGR